MPNSPAKSAEAAASPQHTALLKELWEAAVRLRGSVEPADYKRYVLPIIFLRFLSLRYDRRRAEIEAFVADKKSDCFGDKQAIHDPAEYRRVGAFVIPEAARWENLRKAAQADDIKVKLDDVLESLETKYPEKLKGLLQRIYARANIQLGNSYFDDKHATLKADYVLANPPFNHGSKGESGWGADRIADKDPRLSLGVKRMPLSPRNPNTMWMLHFLSHLKAGGTAGFVMASGELSNGETARLEVRRA